MESFIQILNLDLSLAVLVALVSGVIHGYSGFGSALLMVPLFTLLFNPVEAIAISLIIAAFGSAQLYPGAARNARWIELVPVIVGLAVAAPLGAVALFNTDPELIRRFMGGFVLLAAVILMSGWVYRGSRGIMAGAVVGVLAGGITGVAGVGGPSIALYFLASPEPIEVQRANIVISVAAVIPVMLAVLFIAGGIGTHTLFRAIILSPVYVIGTWSGSRLFTIAPKEYFHRVVLWLLVATGVGVAFF